MHLYKCCFSAFILCIYWQQSAAGTNSTNATAKEIAEKQPVTLELVKLKNLVPRNSTTRKSKESKEGNVGQKREIENGTFNPFESLFLFPILPFLFPPMEDNLIPLDGNELPASKNDSGDKPQERGKPFVFSSFTFNVRDIPVKNVSDLGNDSKIINVKKLADTKGKNRKRRNTRHVGEFFEETFPDAELDEFLPKPDLFFPDMSFHPKTAKKLSRKKRDEKPDVRNDFKFFLDAFDEAFMRTKKELEKTDPILNFIKGMESSFGEEKKEFFNEEENPNVKWKVQRDVKRLNDEGESLGKNEDNPMIIMNKVVKIGEFRLHGDKHEGKKSKRKRKKDADRRKSFEEMSYDEASGKRILDMFREDHSKNTKQYKRNHHEREQIQTPMKPEAIETSLKGNVTELTLTQNDTDEAPNLLKVIDAIRDKLKDDIMEEKKQKRKKVSYEDLKKNITQILNQFLGFVKKMSDGDSSEIHENGDEEYLGNLGLFDWTEKEILDTRTRHKKEFPLEYVDMRKEERKIADIHKNIMSVTMPSILIILLVLIACIWALQPKGAMCKALFRPRKVYTVAEDEERQQQELSKKAKGKKIPTQIVKVEQGIVEQSE